MSGENIRVIEGALNVRSGTLLSMFSEAANILRGLADILFSITAPQDTEFLPTSFDPASKANIIALIGSIRRIAARLDVGLPDDIVWMSTLEDGSQPVLARTQMMSLRSSGFGAPDAILDTGRFPSLMATLGPPSMQTTRLAQKLQAAVRDWRVEERTRLVESQIKRLPAECKSIVQKYYRSREKEFESSLEEVSACLNIAISHKDDGAAQSFPDFIIESLPGNTVSIECKSKVVGDSVTFNDATDILRKASVNGFHQSFKVTVCQPYISPDVIRNITNCPDLCVVNAEDLAEAFVRIKIGKLTVSEFSDWLQRPGQALRDTIPSRTTNNALQSGSA
ncbi:hypothetical protein MKK55_23785 [Methylobacterium sp. J-059]|uniref:hypothetical protein n=1 Tax=Methylobacterium sp. J-059 TaxID=2836643 RepID=UPI001FBA1D03|nr:hypothetical protein [Methylobacterium sp. J-059]MCJ2041951.1 hypothetical protein [Methylobacterium sp. J-059]